MSSFCSDELSPISFGSSNVNNFVLTPNLLLHADDSVKSDDLDLSLLECSFSDDGSGGEVNPHRCQLHTDVDGSVKEVSRTGGDEDLKEKFADVAGCPPSVQLYQHGSYTSDGTKRAEVSQACVLSIACDHEHTCAGDDKDLRQFASISYRPPSIQLHQPGSHTGHGTNRGEQVEVETLSTECDHKHKEVETSVKTKPVFCCISAPTSPLHETLEPPVKQISQAIFKSSPSYKHCGNLICETNSLSFQKRSQSTNCVLTTTEADQSTDLSKVCAQTISTKIQHTNVKPSTSIVTESGAEFSTSCRSRHKTFSHIPNRYESVTTPAYLAQIPRHFQKRRKVSGIESFITESDSDVSVGSKRSQRKVRNDSLLDGYTLGTELEPTVFLRRSERKPKKRFKLDISDSESELPGPVKKTQRRPSRRKRSSSSDSDLHVPVTGLRRSQRIPKKKAYTEYTELCHDSDGDSNQELQPVSEQQPAKNRRKDTSYFGKIDKRQQVTNPQQKQQCTGSQPCSPDYVPVARVVYHQQSLTEQTLSCSKIQGNNFPKSEDSPRNVKSNPHIIKDQSKLYQTKPNKLSGQRESDTRAEHSNQAIASLEYTETYSRNQVVQKSRDICETPGERHILSELSQGQISHSRRKFELAEPTNPQSEDRGKENVSLNSDRGHVRSRFHGRHVLLENTGRKASSRSGKVTFHFISECRDKQDVHKKETSKSRHTRVNISSRKLSEIEHTHRNCTGKLRSESEPSESQFASRVNREERFDLLQTQKVRKIQSLLCTDKSDQKEKKGSVFEFLNTKFSFRGKRNVLSDGSKDENYCEPAVLTKKQKDFVLKEESEQSKQSSKGRAQSQGQDCTKAESHYEKSQVKNKKKISPSSDKPHNCSERDIWSLTVETEVNPRKKKSSPLKSGVAESDRAPKRKDLSKLNTPESIDSDSEGTAVKRNEHLKRNERYYNRKKGVRAKGTHNRQRGGEEKVFNLISLTRAIATERDAIEFCQQHGLLPQSTPCPKCGGLLTKLNKIVRRVKTFSVEFRFQCNKRHCKSKSHVRLRNVCWLSKSTNILCCQYLLIFYLFSNQFTVEQAVEESVVSCENIQLGSILNKKQVNSVCLETVQELYNFCREICVLSLPDPQPVGGVNRTVVILEAQFGETKYCSRVFPEGQVVLGAFCRQTEDLFFVPCPALEPEHVIPVIQKYVKKGSEVQTDNSDIYLALGQLGYKHVTLNHSEHDLDIETGRCLKHNKDSIWWMKKSPSGSASLDKLVTCSSQTVLSSSVPTDIEEHVGKNPGSRGIQTSTPGDDSVKRKLNKITRASDSTVLPDISSILGTYNSSEKLDEALSSNIPKVSVLKTLSDSRSVSVAFSDSFEGFDTGAIFSTPENSVTTGTSAIGASVDTRSTSGRDSKFSADAESWIFALHMGEFLWRRSHRNDKDIFLSFLQATAKISSDQH